MLAATGQSAISSLSCTSSRTPTNTTACAASSAAARFETPRSDNCEGLSLRGLLITRGQELNRRFLFAQPERTIVRTDRHGIEHACHIRSEIDDVFSVIQGVSTCVSTCVNMYLVCVP